MYRSFLLLQRYLDNFSVLEFLIHQFFNKKLSFYCPQHFSLTRWAGQLSRGKTHCLHVIFNN